MGGQEFVMGDIFLQSVAKKTQRKTFSLEDLTKEELIQYIKENEPNKKDLVKFVKAVYITVQEFFSEAYETGDDIDFDILEGKVHYDIGSDIFIFTPNKQVKDLLEKSEDEDTSELKKFLESRFYKMVKTTYELQK